MYHTVLHTGGKISDKNENSVAILRSNDVNPISLIANKVPLNSIGETVANVQPFKMCNRLTQGLRVSFLRSRGLTFIRRKVDASASVLLDQGSTFSFISESLGQALRTNGQRTDLKIKCFGLFGTGTGSARFCVSFDAAFETETEMFPLTAYVYQRITSYVAFQIRPFESWPHLRGLTFADPDPSNHHQIHLLGADIYGSLLMHDHRKSPLETFTAQLTALG